MLQNGSDGAWHDASAAFAVNTAGSPRAAGAAAQKRENSRRETSKRQSRRKTRQRHKKESDKGGRRDEPAAVGVVLGYETAAHGKGSVVHALGGGVVDDDGASRTAAS